MDLTETHPADRLAALHARAVVTIAEATEIVPVSRSTIVRAISAGDLPSRHVGRRVLLPTVDLLRWAGAS